MLRPSLLVALLAAPLAVAQDVYVPPVPIGVGELAKARTRRPVPFPSEQRTWIRLQTTNFDVISSADPKRTAEVARDLETIAAALHGASARFERSGSQTKVFMFARRGDSQPYFDLMLDREGASATGLYVRHGGGGSMFIDAARRFERTAMHELVHDLLRQGDVSPPLWIQEGLAELLGNARVKAGKVIAGDIIREHAVLLRRKGVRPVEEMLSLNDAAAAAASTHFYAQSWAAVQWLIGLEGPETFFAFLRDAEAEVPIEEALQTHYGKSLRDLHDGIRRVKEVRVEFQFPSDVLPATPEPEPLDRATLLYELGAFLAHVAGAEHEKERHFREALRLDPRHARALAAVGDFEGAIAAAPHDPAVRLTYAEALLTLAIGPFAGVFEPQPDDVERFRKAREVLAPVDTPLAHGFIGTSYLVEDDVRPGIAHLERASRRDDFALNLYAMYLRAGEREKAESLYGGTLEHARDPQTRFAARNVRLLAETDRANELARKGDLDGAAKIVRELAAGTTDAAARRELETQAASLEATAAVNRHIGMYNQAIALSNTGRRREALAVLDQLLAVATDPLVLRDAKKLQRDLRLR